jgi:cytochrome c
MEENMRFVNSIALAAVAALSLSAGAASAQDAGDAAKGEKVFKKCQACHNPTEAKNKVGPHLVGIVGRAAGSVEGYKYGEGLSAKAAEIGTWDEAKLDAYLTDPKAFVDGKSKMAFKLGKADERADVIAYLKSLGQ